jgi:hypothetical protein
MNPLIPITSDSASGTPTTTRAARRKSTDAISKRH